MIEEISVVKRVGNMNEGIEEQVKNREVKNSMMESRWLEEGHGSMTMS